MYLDFMEIRKILLFLNTPRLPAQSYLICNIIHSQNKGNQRGQSTHKASCTPRRPARATSKGRNRRGWNGARSAADGTGSSASRVKRRSVSRRSNRADDQSGGRRYLQSSDGRRRADIGDGDRSSRGDGGPRSARCGHCAGHGGGGVNRRVGDAELGAVLVSASAIVDNLDAVARGVDGGAQCGGGGPDKGAAVVDGGGDGVNGNNIGRGAFEEEDGNFVGSCGLLRVC